MVSSARQMYATHSPDASQPIDRVRGRRGSVVSSPDFTRMTHAAPIFVLIRALTRWRVDSLTVDNRHQTHPSRGSFCGYFVTSQYHTLHTRHARLRVVFAFAWRKTIFLFFQKPCRKPLPSYPKLNISSANETNREIDIRTVDPRITCPGRLRFVVKKLVWVVRG
jgi:hypothetical protein